MSNYLAENEKGVVVSGKVTEVDQKQAMIELADGVLGVLRAADAATEKVEDLRTKMQVGDTIEAKVMGADRKVHAVTLSIKAKDAKAPAKKQPAKAKAAAGATTATAGKKKKAESSLKTTFGDLFNIGGDDEAESNK
jgi:small subunit ribosomal protein S1